MKFSISKLLLLVAVQFFTLNAFSQTNVVHENQLFYGDEGGWSLGFSAGALLFDRLDFNMDGNLVVEGEATNGAQVLSASGYSDMTQTIPIPSFTVTGEYRPHRGLSLGIEGSYFQQDHEGVIDTCLLVGPDGTGDILACSDVPFDGMNRTFVLLTGGNYFYGNNTAVTPYLTADVGAGLSILKFNSPGDTVILDDWSTHFVAQGGAGFDVDLGPATLGVVYNYVLLGEQDLYQNDSFDVPDTSGSTTTVNVRNRFSLKQLSGHRGELKLSIKPGVLRGAK